MSIELKNLCFNYHQDDELVLDNITLTIPEGDFIAITGMNGSGKSTLARHLNGLLLPVRGSCSIDNKHTTKEHNLLAIRQKVGMVFQNPDNQIIAATVEDDVAFGPENLGLPPREIRQRVKESLQAVGLEAEAQTAPYLLSGGQKQLVSIAGILAMRTKYIVLDEPTAMLDPLGRACVMKTLCQLHEQFGLTIILITHFMEEASLANRIVVLNKGKIALTGTPTEIFSQTEHISALGLELPLAAQLNQALIGQGLPLPSHIYDKNELIEKLAKLF